MKKLLNKLLISIIIIILVFNFIIVPQAQAISLGGILIKPITAVLMVPLDIAAFIITCVVGVFSNGAIDWARDWVADGLSVVENSWATDQSLIDGIGNTLETAVTVNGLGFLTMEDFFRGEIDLSNINIFTSESNNTIIVSLKQSAAEWYYALRNIAAIGLLCALIYTAIRIMLTTIAEEKAHYKDMLTDWVKAVCLVLFIHVLMILILNVTDTVVSILASMTNRYSSIAWVRKQLLFDFDITQVVYLVMYGMLIYYTVVFAISYMKRFLYTILLIVIAPIIGLVYAFGKEGKSIFQKWLKEFVTNAFLQPYHMVIYTVLFGFVSTIADDGQNMMVAIYSIIVLHFIRDAEKYYRSLFGMGTGVAGMGQADTGIETIERVKKKTTQIVQQVGKVALSVATLAIPGASIAAGAANAAQAGQAAQAMGAAKDLGDIENGFNGGGNPPNGPNDPDTPLLGGPSGGGPNGPDIGGGNELELQDAGDVNIDDVRDLEAEEEAYRRAPYDGATYSPKEEDSLLNDGGENGDIVNARSLEVDTVTAQALETQQGDLQSMDTNDLDAASVRADRIKGDVETDGLNTDELEAEVIEGEKATQGRVHNNRIENGGYESSRVQNARLTIGRAFDAINGGHAGETTARIWNRSNDIYQRALDEGADPNDPNTRINTAIEGADQILNRRDADNEDVSGVVIQGEGNDRSTISESSNGDAYTTLGINSSTTNENKANTEVKLGNTSSGTMSVSGISQATIEKMLKGMPKLSDSEITQMAQKISRNVKGEVDAKQLESMIRAANGGAQTKVDVQNIGDMSTDRKNIHVEIEGVENTQLGKGNQGAEKPDLGLPEGNGKK